jgi:hypothetical protein
MITQNELKQVLHYNQDTGVFTWLVSKQGQKGIGSKAGCLTLGGYYSITIDREFYLAHRLAWFYVYGTWPANTIDHINGDTQDNRICNLREATSSQNGMNRLEQSNNTSGHRGVTFHKKAQKWRAHIKINQKQKHLGLFITKELAIEARNKAEEELFRNFRRS